VRSKACCGDEDDLVDLAVREVNVASEFEQLTPTPQCMLDKHRVATRKPRRKSAIEIGVRALCQPSGSDRLALGGADLVRTLKVVGHKTCELGDTAVADEGPQYAFGPRPQGLDRSYYAQSPCRIDHRWQLTRGKRLALRRSWRAAQVVRTAASAVKHGVASCATAGGPATPR
jgi:hypothetical protein